MMRGLLVIVALLTCSVRVSAQEVQEVDEFMTERWAAFDARNADATAELYADDAIVINVTGDMHVGHDAIAAFYQHIFSGLIPSDLGPRRCEEATIQMMGPDAAVHTQECTLYDVLPAEEAEGRRLPIRHFRATHVLVRRDQGWKILGFRNIPIWNPFDWQGPNQ